MSDDVEPTITLPVDPVEPEIEVEPVESDPKRFSKRFIVIALVSVLVLTLVFFLSWKLLSDKNGIKNNTENSEKLEKTPSFTPSSPHSSSNALDEYEKPSDEAYETTDDETDDASFGYLAPPPAVLPSSCAQEILPPTILLLPATSESSAQIIPPPPREFSLTESKQAGLRVMTLENSEESDHRESIVPLLVGKDFSLLEDDFDESEHLFFEFESSDEANSSVIEAGVAESKDFGAGLDEVTASTSTASIDSPITHPPLKWNPFIPTLETIQETGSESDEALVTKRTTGPLFDESCSEEEEENVFQTVLRSDEVSEGDEVVRVEEIASSIGDGAHAVDAAVVEERSAVEEPVVVEEEYIAVDEKSTVVDAELLEEPVFVDDTMPVVNDVLNSIVAAISTAEEAKVIPQPPPPDEVVHAHEEAHDETENLFTDVAIETPVNTTPTTPPPSPVPIAIEDNVFECLLDYRNCKLMPGESNALTIEDWDRVLTKWKANNPEYPSSLMVISEATDYAASTGKTELLEILLHLKGDVEFSPEIMNLFKRSEIRDAAKAKRHLQTFLAATGGQFSESDLSAFMPSTLITYAELKPLMEALNLSTLYAVTYAIDACREDLVQVYSNFLEMGKLKDLVTFLKSGAPIRNSRGKVLLKNPRIKKQNATCLMALVDQAKQLIEHSKDLADKKILKDRANLQKELLSFLGQEKEKTDHDASMKSFLTGLIETINKE